MKHFTALALNVPKEGFYRQMFLVAVVCALAPVGGTIYVQCCGQPSQEESR